MKKLLTGTAILAILAGTVFAYGPYGYGPGKGNGFQRPCQMGQGMGPGMMAGKGFGPGANATNAVTEEDATKTAENFISQNLKGYKIENKQKIQVPRGTAYFFTVSDGKNKFQVHVNPFGYVRGPIPISQ
ncbi:MAG: PepSY domain-containing protein [Calditerrivibrio sp.]|jgi:hypothetical protein|uniref:PepSY domain-containing protein n=1 Tax=Calditerrivibrio sp. TaxID=2792612 RepID=UPI003D0FB56F